MEALRAHAKCHPEDNYAQLAATFGISEISVKRYCADLGRGKDWRRGRKQARPHAGRFWASVDRSSGSCWPWRGCLNDSGYGTVYFDGKSQGTHRIAYILKHGEIPAGAEVDHMCRNRACCNPDHLEAITHAQNMERMREVQPERASGGQRRVPGPIDTGGSIDTRPIDQFNPESDSPRPVSVSISPGVTTQAVNGRTPAEDVARRFHDRASDIWGDCPNPRQRRLPDGTYDLTPDSFHYYLMNVDGIKFRMIARSEWDARLIVEKSWGVHPRITVEEVVKIWGVNRAIAAEVANIWTLHLWITVEEVEDEKPDEDAIDTWLGDWDRPGDWSRCLHSSLDDWKRNEPGKHWVALQEQRRKDEQDRRKGEDGDWFDHCVESRERQSESKSARHRTRGVKAPRGYDELDWDRYDQGAEWEGEDFEPDEFEDD